MIESFEKRLDFDSDTFEGMKRDMNFVLQRLIGNMKEKESNEGSMTLKIDVIMVNECIPNYNPDIKGETREISKPQFKHKVTSVVKINDEKSGNLNNEMALVMDEDTGVFKLVPVADTMQRSIFDADFKQQTSKDEDIIEGTAVEGNNIPQLPSPQADGEVMEGEFREVGTSDNQQEDSGEYGEDMEDITDELLGKKESDGEDNYNYDEPEE